MEREKILKNQSGVALVIALVMIVVITLIGLASTFTSIFEIKLAGNKRGSVDAFYAADGGIEVTISNIDNFNLSGKYVDNEFDPFTDPNNLNPTNADVIIHYDPAREGAPRGFGISAAGNFGFKHFLIESTGEDQVDSSFIKSTCTIDQKVVRLVPSMQGGY